MKLLAQKIQPILLGWIQNQNIGRYQEGKPCCIGARIAGILLNESHYSYGKAWFYEEAKKLGYSYSEVTEIMEACGATDKPFLFNKWFCSAEKVIQRLSRIEKPLNKNQYSLVCLLGGNLLDKEFDFMLSLSESEEDSEKVQKIKKRRKT